MDNAQTAPPREEFVVMHCAVDADGAVAEAEPSQRFGPAAQSGRAAIGEVTVEVELFGGMGENRRTGPVAQPGGVARVIEVTVGEQDRVDGGGREV